MLPFGAEGVSSSIPQLPELYEHNQQHTIITQGGKEYHVKKITTKDHGLVWKVRQGVEAFFGTLFSFGIGLLFSESLRNKWTFAFTGDETISIVTPLDRPFIEQAKVDLEVFSLQGLETGLMDALAKADTLNDQEKTTVWTITERIAQIYMEKGNGQKAIEVRMTTTRAIGASPPLSDLKFKLSQEHLQWGMHISPLDTGVLKNHVISVQKRTFEGEDRPTLHFELKLNHFARKNIQHTIDFARKNPHELFKALPTHFCSGFSMTEENDVYYGKNKDGTFSKDIDNKGSKVFGPVTCYKAKVNILNFEGVGKVNIGDDPKVITQYPRVTIDLDPSIPEDEAMEKLTVILGVLGLGVSTSPIRDVDEERIKIMQLFRAFYPREAYKIEHQTECSVESIPALKRRIESLVPDMTKKFKKYLIDQPDLMYRQEIYSGYSIWAIKGLTQEVRAAGGIGLFAGVVVSDFTDATERIVSILKLGSVSTYDRFKNGMIVKGSSPYMDLISGGAASVFTRLYTKKMPKALSNYTFAGKLQILYDLTLIDRVGYAYSIDAYGTKEEEAYQDRPSILELTKQIEHGNPNSFTSNEVCILNRIPPQYIKGLLVSTPSEKEQLIKVLRQENLIVLNDKNEECVNGKPIDQFIHIGDVQPSYWD